MAVSAHLTTIKNQDRFKWRALAFSHKEDVTCWINAADVAWMILIFSKQQHCNHHTTYNYSVAIIPRSFIHSFISGMHHYECVAPNVDIILQSGQFWATSIASFRKSFSDSRSCWVVFILVSMGHPGGLLQFSKEEAVKICLASDADRRSYIFGNCFAEVIAEVVSASV